MLNSRCIWQSGCQQFQQLGEQHIVGPRVSEVGEPVPLVPVVIAPILSSLAVDKILYINMQIIRHIQALHTLCAYLFHFGHAVIMRLCLY